MYEGILYLYVLGKHPIKVELELSRDMQHLGAIVSIKNMKILLAQGKNFKSRKHCTETTQRYLFLDSIVI